MPNAGRRGTTSQLSAPSRNSTNQPTRLQLDLNQKTVKALGIEFPATFLAREDGVIE